MSITCSQCGSPVEVSEGQEVAACPACASSLFLVLNEPYLHYRIAPTIHRRQVGGILRRWLKAHEVRGDPKIARVEPRLWPFWEIARGARRSIYLAATSSIPELEDIALTGGAREFFGSEMWAKPDVVEPEVDAVAARTRFRSELGELDENDTTKDDDCTVSLLHVPLFEVAYEVGGGAHRVLVDAVTGGVHADDVPHGFSVPMDASHTIAFVVTLGVFIALGSVSKGLFQTLIAYVVGGVLLYLLLDRYLLARLKG